MNLTGNVLDITRISKNGACARGASDRRRLPDCRNLPDRYAENGHRRPSALPGIKVFLGPQGNRRTLHRLGIEIRPLLRGGTGVTPTMSAAGVPTRLEAGTLNSHGLAGLDAALDFLLATGVEKIYARERLLMRRFYEAVRDIPGVMVSRRLFRRTSTPPLLR